MKFSTLAIVVSVCATCCVASIGDRLTLEIEYLKEYRSLPLTTSVAVAEAWQVEDECHGGLGRRATHADSFGSLRLWFDRAGAVMGYGVSTAESRDIDFLLRDPAAACGEGAAAVPGSIGDRLLVVVEGTTVQMPLSRDEATAADFPVAGPCWTDMGQHTIYPDYTLPLVVMPMFTGDGLHLTGMNSPSRATEQTPSFEKFEEGRGGPVHGHHVYFSEHVGVCGDAPTLAPFPPAPMLV